MRDLASLQPLRPRQLGLPFIKRPKAIRFEFHGAGDVQGVEGAHTEFVAVLSRKLSAELEGVFGQRRCTQKPRGFVRDELRIYALGSLPGQVPSKLLLRERVGPFGAVERSQDKPGSFFNTAACL